MEKGEPKLFWRVFKIVFGVIEIAIGLFAVAYGFLCLYVDGVHFIAYTISPAIALVSFFIAWLLLRRKKRPPEQHAAE